MSEDFPWCGGLQIRSASLRVDTITAIFPGESAVQPSHCCLPLRVMPMDDQTPPIRVLTFAEAVQKRPGMYAGEEGPEMLQHLIDELVSNSIDQYLRGAATRIEVCVRDDGMIVVADDGPGLPFDQPDPEGEHSLAARYLRHPHFTAQADEGSPHIHLHRRTGMGQAVVNVLSEELICRSWRAGCCWEQRFARGIADGPPRVIAEGSGKGTVFHFRPIAALVKAEAPDWKLLRASLWRAVHLFGGLQIRCGDEWFVACDGLADYLPVLEDLTTRSISQWRQRPLFHWCGRVTDYQIEAVASGFGGGYEPPCRWRSWISGRPTPLHGSHVVAFARALRQQGWRPGAAMIHVTTHDPRFAGSTRDRYASKEAAVVIQAAHADPLEAYCAAQKLGRFAPPH